MCADAAITAASPPFSSTIWILSEKSFGMALSGASRESIDDVRRGGAKCVLLCANCHAEVEDGDASLH